MSQGPICSQHSVAAKWREGVSKTTGKNYGFWSCSITKEQNGGVYCDEKFSEPKPFFGNAAPAASYQQTHPPVTRVPDADKGDIITGLAIIKSLIGAGRSYSLESVREFHAWKNLAEGKTIKVPAAAPVEEEIPLENLPF